MVQGLKYTSNPTLLNQNFATREIEIDTERDKDAMAIYKRNVEISRNIIEGKLESDVYRGKNAKVMYSEKSEKDLNNYKVTGSLGPMRAPTNLRVNCRFDYAPGICKDYKETGFCGFGDGCVFMHDRGDYKTGWELEEEWRKEQIQKQLLIKEGKYNPGSDEEYEVNEFEAPLICQICDRDFINPVVTKCEHYFCEKCALTHYSKSSSCYVCRKSTQGIFNNCDKFIEKLKNKRIIKKGYEKKTYTDSVDEERDNMKYLEKKEIDLEECEEEIKLDKKKKNKFKVQNSWLYLSDFKSYD